VGGNTTLNFVPQFNAAYATFPSNFGDACTFDPAYFPVNAAQFNGTNNTWTGHDGRLYGYQQSESFLWCYDPAINEFALVHGDLAPCCDWDDLFAGFTPEYGTLGEPSLDNSPGAVAGPSWVDLDGNFWMLMPLFYDPTPESWGCGPMMRFMPDPTCLGVGSALTVDSVSIEAYNSYTNPLGDIYTQGGQYTYTLGQTGGCPIQVVLNLTIIPELSFELPNIFTPNGDGVNDRFVPFEAFPGKWVLTIFNRWGSEVFSSTNLVQGWNGEEAPSGTYYWVIEPRDGQQGESVSGYVTLLRE
jgi:gliding motility-associated-like protein